MRVLFALRDALALLRCWGVVCLIGTPLQASAAELPETIERIRGSVVAVGTYQKTRSPAFVFHGTGFVVGDGTLVATNAHVLPPRLAAESQEVLVIVAPQPGGSPRPQQAKALAVDKTHDVALLKIDGEPLPVLQLHEAAVREGQVFAFTGFPIGNVLGLSPVTHRAMVSSITPIALPSPTARQLDPKVITRIRNEAFPVFQLDGTAYPGNSGSPLYDIATGHVVGIINMVFVKGTREAALSQPSGITFAVPVRHLRELLKSAHAR